MPSGASVMMTPKTVQASASRAGPVPGHGLAAVFDDGLCQDQCGDRGYAECNGTGEQEFFRQEEDNY